MILGFGVRNGSWTTGCKTSTVAGELTGLEKTEGVLLVSRGATVSWTG